MEHEVSHIEIIEEEKPAAADKRPLWAVLTDKEGWKKDLKKLGLLVFLAVAILLYELK